MTTKIVRWPKEKGILGPDVVDTLQLFRLDYLISDEMSPRYCSGLADLARAYTTIENSVKTNHMPAETAEFERVRMITRFHAKYDPVNVRNLDI